MEQKVLKTRIKQRIDTAENWAQTTEAPLEGELIIYKSTDSTIPDKIKIGDGVTTASNLPFITNEYATDEEILAAMIEADLMPAAQLEDGSLLAADENNVLLI